MFAWYLHKACSYDGDPAPGWRDDHAVVQVVRGGASKRYSRRLAGLLSRCLFQRDSGDSTRRAQTRRRRVGFRRAMTARPMLPVRSVVPVMTWRGR